VFQLLAPSVAAHKKLIRCLLEKAQPEMQIRTEWRCEMKTSLVVLAAALAAGVALVVVDSHGRSSKNEPLPTAHADESAVCSMGSLSGSYSLFGTGTALQALGPLPAGPIAEVALYNFDGRGSLTANGTLSFGGVVIRSTATGSYQVNPDCTVSFVIVASVGGHPVTTVHAEGVMHPDGRKITIVQTDPGFVQLRTLEEQ
jgi:hypothetical protein